MTAPDRHHRPETGCKRTCLVHEPQEGDHSPISAPGMFFAFSGKRCKPLKIQLKIDLNFLIP